MGTEGQIDGSGIQRKKAYQNYLDVILIMKIYEYKDLGISGRGKNSKAGALNKLLKMLKKVKFLMVLFSSLCRGYQEKFKDALELLLRIFKSGLTIAFTEYEEKYLMDKEMILHGFKC